MTATMKLVWFIGTFSPILIAYLIVKITEKNT
jgi:hypothetical protein